MTSPNSKLQRGPYLLLLGGRGWEGCTFPIVWSVSPRYFWCYKVTSQLPLRESQMPLGKPKQRLPKIEIAMRACYCWVVEGGRDVHFQLCGPCQASHHSLKDVTQRFFGFCQKILGRKKKRWRDDGARS